MQTQAAVVPSKSRTATRYRYSYKYKSKPKDEFTLSEVAPELTLIRMRLKTGTKKTMAVIICARVVILVNTCNGRDAQTVVVAYAQFRSLSGR